MSRSTRSALVSTTMPCAIPSRRQISKCSRVWGLMDSSAAITSRTRSMPPTPASMFLTKRSWPGTSTKPMRSSGVRSRCAKPRSMEMPRRFSSSRRSVSMPVSALHQRGLAVVDVARGASYDVLHAAATHPNPIERRSRPDARHAGHPLARSDGGTPRRPRRSTGTAASPSPPASPPTGSFLHSTAARTRIRRSCCSRPPRNSHCGRR